MDSPNEPLAKRTRSISAEAVIGTGVTIAALGVLFLLLGWAQAMRGVHPASWILLALGAVCVVIGGITAAAAPRGDKGGQAPRATAAAAPESQV
jgi:hypothetical protein